jgi:sugar/nucleoside kinase (ribokinase family)
LAGLPRAHKVYTSRDGRKRTAIVINNDQLDATLITQLSNEDCVTVEMRSEAVKFFSVSMYFDIHRDIEDIRQPEKVMDYTKENGLIIAADSNARRKMWHDTITNQRRKIPEEFLICNDLFVMNEATETPTFQSNRGSSCIDLTIANSRLVQYVSD